MSNKWTPGPLEVLEGLAGDEMFHIVAQHPDDPESVMVLAVIQLNESIAPRSVLDQYAANALLFAASPDLAEAMEGLMWRFDDDDSDPHEPEETAPDILAARAALALAKGEE